MVLIICFQAVVSTGSESGLDCKTIIYALAAVITAMAAFIVKQFVDRITDLKETNRLASTLEGVVHNERTPGRQG